MKKSTVPLIMLAALSAVSCDPTTIVKPPDIRPPASERLLCYSSHEDDSRREIVVTIDTESHLLYLTANASVGGASFAVPVGGIFAYEADTTAATPDLYTVTRRATGEAFGTYTCRRLGKDTLLVDHDGRSFTFYSVPVLATYICTSADAELVMHVAPTLYQVWPPVYNAYLSQPRLPSGCTTRLKQGQCNMWSTEPDSTGLSPLRLEYIYSKPDVAGLYLDGTPFVDSTFAIRDPQADCNPSLVFQKL